MGTLMRDEAAKKLNVSLPTLDALLRRTENPLPSIRVGRKWLIPEAMLEEWLREEAGRQSARR